MIRPSRLSILGMIALLISWGIGDGNAAPPTEPVDPTRPSSQIMAKLLADDGSAPSTDTAPAIRNAHSLELTLKGLVLSDADHGTAIIAHQGTEFAVVSLDRDQTKAERTRVKIAGTTLVVADFSATKVSLESLDGARRYQVPRPRD